MSAEGTPLTESTALYLRVRNAAHIARPCGGMI